MQWHVHACKHTHTHTHTHTYMCTHTSTNTHIHVHTHTHTHTQICHPTSHLSFLCFTLLYFIFRFLLLHFCPPVCAWEHMCMHLCLHGQKVPLTICHCCTMLFPSPISVTTASHREILPGSPHCQGRRCWKSCLVCRTPSCVSVTHPDELSEIWQMIRWQQVNPRISHLSHSWGDCQGGAVNSDRNSDLKWLQPHHGGYWSPRV